jgi:hypothetical protein
MGKGLILSADEKENAPNIGCGAGECLVWQLLLHSSAIIQPELKYQLDGQPVNTK